MHAERLQDRMRLVRAPCLACAQHVENGGGQVRCSTMYPKFAAKRKGADTRESGPALRAEDAGIWRERRRARHEQRKGDSRPHH